MSKLTGEEEIIREILDIFSKTSLDIESNREIIAGTIAKELNENRNKLERSDA